jgi:hypothetical protein
MNRNQSLYPNTYQQELQKSKQFGQKVRGGIDRGLGFLGGVGLGTYGMASDATSGILSALGLDDAAVFHARNADELHNRAKQQFLKGYSGGGSRSDLPGGSRALSRTANLIDDGTAPLYNFTYDDIPDAYPQNPLIDIAPSGLPRGSNMNFGDIPIGSLPEASLSGGSFTQDEINEILSDLPKSPQALPESPEMTQYKENILTDPRGGDKSLEGAAQTLGITEEKLGSMSKEKKEDALQKAFASGVDSYQEALLGKKKTQPKFKNKQEAIDYYKKEFADATGIKIDGKPDTKDAMIAFGLALMQNKAGKKFDVGKMLEATGKAGEKAMPLLTKAKDQAKAEQVAAGKYALDQITAGKSASAALAAEERAFAREVALKQMENDRKIQEALAKGQEIKGGYNDERLKGLEIRMGNTAKGAVFSHPNAALNKINDRLKATNGGIATVDEITKLAQDIINEDYTSLSLVKDRANSILVGFGIADKNLVFGEKGMSDEDNLKALQDSLISRYKKFLTQETGNGISNTDVERLQALLGKIDLIGNPEASLVRLEEVRQIFEGERRKARNVADELLDPRFYQSQEIYDSMDFNKLIENSKSYSVITASNSSTPRIKVSP